MKKILLNLMSFFVILPTMATIVHTANPNITLDANSPNNFITITIEGKTIAFSHWSFGASGFQIDGNNDFVGLVESSTSNLLKRLNFGDNIDVNQDFVPFSGYAPAYHSDIFGGIPAGGLLIDGESTYFGFKVSANNGIYYAWLKITRVSSGVVTIDEYAYENTVNTSITAGATGGGTGNILVTSISVQNQGGQSVITTFGGTLQLLATVLPTNATDNSVSWSVLNGAAFASVNASGLVTAISDGTATLAATANDGSGISGFKTVTVSNQTASITSTEVPDFSIYPNPTKNQLTISTQLMEVKSVEVIALNGQIMLRTNVNNTAVQTIDISDLETGVYWVKVHAAGGDQYIEKIIKY